VLSDAPQVPQNFTSIAAARPQEGHVCSRRPPQRPQ
jgi:hypothetical protein